jgi:hypothetical protein
MHIDMRVDVAQAIARGGRLGASHVARAMDDLALQIGRVDRVEVHKAERADPRGGQIERDRRTESARTDDEHARALEPALPLGAHLGQHEVARVAQELVGLEFGERTGHARILARAGRRCSVIPWGRDVRRRRFTFDPRGTFAPCASRSSAPAPWAASSAHGSQARASTP